MAENNIFNSRRRKILLKIKARLFEKGYEVEYSEIIGKALKFFGEKFFLT